MRRRGIRRRHTFPSSIELDRYSFVHVFRQVQDVFLLGTFPLVGCASGPAAISSLAPAPASPAASAPPSAVGCTSASAAALVGSVGHFSFFLSGKGLRAFCSSVPDSLGVALWGLDLDDTRAELWRSDPCVGFRRRLLRVFGGIEISYRSRLSAAHGKLSRRNRWR